jgi:branched-chain amino acid transport system substrate-binding protein
MSARTARLAAVVAVLVALAVVGVLVLGGDGAEEAPRTVKRAAAKPLNDPACSPVSYAGDGRPSALVVMSTLLQGAFADHGIQAVQAIKLVVARHGWHAGSHAVGIQVCDEVPYGSDESDPRKCRRTARAVAANPAVLGVIGPWSSSCAAMVSVLNRAEPPVVVVSPSATYVGLTRRGAGVAPGDPDRFAPTGQRSFVRVVPADDVQAATAVEYARRHGARRLFVLDDRGLYGKGLAGGIRESARRARLPVVGSAGWQPTARGLLDAAARVRRTGADAVYLAGYVSEDNARLIADLRRELGPELLILAPDGFAAPGLLVREVGKAAEGLVYTIATLPRRALPPGGRRFAEDFRQRFGAAPCCFAVQAAQAAEVLLAAIGRSDGTRRGVMQAVLESDVKDGELGDFRFDAAGDTTRNTMGVFEIRAGRSHFIAAMEPPRELLPRD